jgi:hypothetical protein
MGQELELLTLATIEKISVDGANYQIIVVESKWSTLCTCGIRCFAALSPVVTLGNDFKDQASVSQSGLHS